MSLLTAIFGTAHERDMKTIQPFVDRINALEPQMQKLTDEELKAQTPKLKQRLANGESVDALLEEAFATCREAGRRVLGMRHYDVQLVGGYVLHKGACAEMRTGEGKTLVATLPVYLNALTGKGVHVVTVNDYLAKRDAAWMGQIYTFLGLTVDTITHELDDEGRKRAYGADITYCTNNELGFDYLRDNMKFNIEDYVQRPLHYAIVDECDSILIDEARTPLIISGPAEDNTEVYLAMHKVAKQLKPDLHFTMEEKNRSVALTEEGNAALDSIMGIENIYDPQHIDKLHHIYQALKAIHLFKKDVDYMVMGDEVVIVDEFTGRLMEGRRWSDGLHQAVEAKEGVKIKNENQTLASITFQNYFRMYEKIAGMTGTADTEAAEFNKIYSLNVHVIPTNKPMVRKDKDDVVYKTEQAKFNAIIEDILERQKKGQPVLVGTVSIEKSEALGRALGAKGIPHNVLNAKHHEREAEIVAQAGRKGAITIATNMAGRGTDIVLGGNPEFLAKGEVDDEASPEFKKALEKFKSQCEAEKKEVLAAGGLYIIGTERHESRRIDNQLRGRSGRQGDPGESRFYLSLGDDLMRKFNGERIQKIMTTLNVPEDEPITARMVSRSIEGAQRKVEGHNFEIRKHLLEYDDVMNEQRKAVYSRRRSLLVENDEGENKIDETVKEMLGEVTSGILDTFANEEVKRELWDLDGLKVAVENQFGIHLSIPEQITSDKLTEMVVEAVRARFEQQKAMMGPIFEDVQKSILLSAIDHYWKEHLQRVDRIREWVNLKAYAQKDPLLEYKRETFLAFEEMNQFIHRDTVEKLMKVRLVTEATENPPSEEERDEVLESFRPKAPREMHTSRGHLMGEESDEDSQQMSRAQRRRMDKSKKKKKLF
ncbi:MAG: preprotein translocase subunit SecA [Bdellovibrionales bacterium]|nr:preprotein translocase subunit SecA [Bdellovibrionales bacterium]